LSYAVAKTARAARRGPYVQRLTAGRDLAIAGVMSTVVDVPKELTDRIIACAMTVHNQLGPGFLEAVYEDCFEIELKAEGLAFNRERRIPLVYRNVRIGAVYKLDFVVENSVVVELKSVESLAPVHRAQVINYLKLTGLPVGLLLNFNVPLMKDGIPRLEHPDLYHRKK
jgi:GxxExxY protein